MKNKIALMVYPRGLRASIGGEVLIDFPRQFKKRPDFVIGAVRSAPVRLARAGLPEGKNSPPYFMERTG